jgi:hypothetical protein
LLEKNSAISHPKLEQVVVNFDKLEEIKQRVAVMIFLVPWNNNKNEKLKKPC